MQWCESVAHLSVKRVVTLLRLIIPTSCNRALAIRCHEFRPTLVAEYVTPHTTSFDNCNSILARVGGAFHCLTSHTTIEGRYSDKCFASPLVQGHVKTITSITHVSGKREHAVVRECEHHSYKYESTTLTITTTHSQEGTPQARPTYPSIALHPNRMTPPHTSARPSPYPR